MLQTAADYKFVHPQNIIIDGGLSPRRQGQARLTLRGEDAAFLREAACRTSYLTYKSADPAANADFTANTSQKCGGICDRYILSEPIKYSNTALKTVLRWFSSRQIADGGTFIWTDSQYPSYGRTLPEMLSTDMASTTAPDHTQDFNTGSPFVNKPIQELEECISAFTYPTRRGTVTEAWNSGVDGEWKFEWNAGGYWDDYSGPYGPDAPTGASPFPNGHPRRENLEAIYSSTIFQGASSPYTGWATRRWNPNSSTDMYSYLYMPQPNGIQWTDRDNVVHNADPDLTPLLIQNSSSATQAIAEFEVYQNWWIYKNFSIYTQDEWTKIVCVPVGLTSGDLSYGRWRIDKHSLYNAASQAFAQAGASKMNTSFLQSKGMQTTDTYAGSGGTSYAKLRTIHGIFTLNDDLKIVV